MRDQARVTAVLGPTNTGKTHYAIERMLGHRTGVIGLPLRLLAREIYDRIVAARGPSVVALVTGEERIVPERTQYWVCTVEAMPLEIGADFVAVDEIQLCADAERGHVFTDRLLNARGLLETMFLGADTMRGAIAALVPKVQFLRRERFSQLTWTGSKKISRMPPRSAIVGFSVENVYAIAELIRRQKGGCAVVMGALSPRTRNAQVELYQNGDVDYLVATDAIGMGLNLDIGHVAFSSTAKFDGHRIRPLIPNELAQIAGRAGRHLSPGSFGVTGDARPLADEVIEAIESHRFAPVKRLHWRNADLDFGSAGRLIASLERQTEAEWLTRMRDADDLIALKTLADLPEVRRGLRDARDVRLLWDVCRIPDFRGISPTEHSGLLARIFGFLHENGRVPDHWLAGNIDRIDRTDGDIDTLSRRLAYIRTWTYVAQRRGWVVDESHWREATRAVEDRLSDALHARLTQRFVDRRTSVLMRRLKQKESLVAEVNDKGEVTVEGQFIGRIEGFRFRQDSTASADEARTLRQAALQALAPQFHLRADQFYNSSDNEMDITEQGGLMWGDTAVGKLVAGPEVLKPQVEPFVDEAAGAEVADKVRRRLQHFVDRRIAALFEPLLGLARDETLAGLTRGFAFRMVEALGILPRGEVAEEVKALDQEARGALRRHGLRFGQYTVFMPLLLKPAPTRLRLVLWSLSQGLENFPESPPPGLVTIPVVEGVPEAHYGLSGYRPAGTRAIRIDMLERLADLLRAQNSRSGFEATPDMLSITGLTLEQFADLMQGLGYRAERGERVKVKPAPKTEDVSEAPPNDRSEPPQAPVEAAQSATPEPVSEAEAPTVEPAASQAATAALDAAPEAAETAAPPASVPEQAEADKPGQDDHAQPPPGEAADTDAGTPASPSAGTGPEPAGVEPAAEGSSDAPAAAEAALPELEVYYTFSWAPRTRSRPRGSEPGRQGRPGRASGGQQAAGDADAGRKQGEVRAPAKGRPGKPKGKPRGKPSATEGKPRQYAASPDKPARKDRIDPDNPFAQALMGLRERK
jgi:ATP-dependent RNA helicase SUPV3L1/SUV3